MSTFNTIDKFGRTNKKQHIIKLHSPYDAHLKLTSSGHFNVENKQLKNLGAPTDRRDATPKEYVDFKTGKLLSDMKQLIESLGEATKRDDAITLQGIREGAKSYEDRYNAIKAQLDTTNSSVNSQSIDHESVCKKLEKVTKDMESVIDFIFGVARKLEIPILHYGFEVPEKYNHLVSKPRVNVRNKKPVIKSADPPTFM